jgi:hypothetical protein
MTNNTSTFTPSTQILEAGEKAQTIADAGKTLKPFLPQEAQQAVEGVDKVAKAFTATGRALEHFGFDLAEPEVTTFMVELIPTGTSTLPQEAQQGVEAVDKVAKPFTATGRVLEHFGFDEAESIDSFPVEDIDPGFMGSVIEPYSQSILESPWAPPVTLLPSIDLNPALV